MQCASLTTLRPRDRPSGHGRYPVRVRPLFSGQPMDLQESEKKTIHRVLAGDTSQFALLVQTYSPPIYNLAVRLTGSLHDAEELTQETFVKAFQGLRRYDPERKFFSWIYTIAVNTIRSHLQKNPPIFFDHDLSATPADTKSNPELKVIRTQENDLLTQALQKIPLDLREAVLLRFYQELSFGEVSEILGISTSAAKMRVYRALEQLEKLLADH